MTVTALFAEDVDLAALAETVGTPFFCYSSAAMVGRYQALAAVLDPLGVDILFAVKANSNQAVIATLAAAGAGADVVSEGEIRQALAAGVPAHRIVFAGVAKTEAEMAFALEAGIGQFNVESFAELTMLDAVARKWGGWRRSTCASTPMSTPGPMKKSPPGEKKTNSASISPRLPPFSPPPPTWPASTPAACLCISARKSPIWRRLRRLSRSARDDLGPARAGVTIDHLDIGGGLGIVYGDETAPDLDRYAAIVRDTVGDLGCRLSVEPGRFLVGNAGIWCAGDFGESGRNPRFHFHRRGDE